MLDEVLRGLGVERTAKTQFGLLFRAFRLAFVFPGALRRMYMLERACEVEVIARGLDEEPAPIDPEVIRRYGERARQQRANPHYGMTYWNAALRQIEGKGIDWRQ